MDHTRIPHTVIHCYISSCRRLTLLSASAASSINTVKVLRTTGQGWLAQLGPRVDWETKDFDLTVDFNAKVDLTELTRWNCDATADSAGSTQVCNEQVDLRKPIPHKCNNKRLAPQNQRRGAAMQRLISQISPIDSEGSITPNQITGTASPR